MIFTNKLFTYVSFLPVMLIFHTFIIFHDTFLHFLNFIQPIFQTFLPTNYILYILSCIIILNILSYIHLQHILIKNTV